MRTTIRDVAKKLNLSITTVSRALDGYDDVSPQTRELVIQAAAEMGYVPNRAARQLRRQRTETIGYILPAVSPQFADPFHSEFIAGLGDESAAQEYDLLVSTAPPDTDAEKAVYRRWVQSGKVDGLIVNRTRLRDWRLEFLNEHHVPAVSLERPAPSLPFHGVETDGKTAVQELVSHLLTLGHSRMAFIGAEENLKIQHDRLIGYQTGLEMAQVTRDEQLIRNGDLTSEGGMRAARELLGLAHRPTAIICINDLTAIGAIHAARDHDLVVGRDIAIAGFDGTIDSAHTHPPLTSLDQPVYDMARLLVKNLVALIQGKTDVIPTQIKPRLLIRASTG